MSKKFFFVVFISDPIIKTILDGMKIIADPSQKSPSHVTVKGPYSSFQKKILENDSEQIKDLPLKVLGAGNFFNENQNTVFFKCEKKEELINIWKSKDERTYKEFNPHITIYDGRDDIFAKKLYNTIDSHNIHFSFLMPKLDVYSSRGIYNLKNQTDFQSLSKILRFNLNEEDVSALSSDERLSLIDRLSENLSNAQTKLCKQCTSVSDQKKVSQKYDQLRLAF